MKRKPIRADWVHTMLVEAGPKGCTPTELGLACGYDYSAASGAMRSPLRWLIERGLAVRVERCGRCVVHYVAARYVEEGE